MAVLSFPAFFGVGGPFLDIFGILGPKMGSKVPYLISGIARNGNYYLPCDFEPNPWRVDFRENCKGVPLQNFTKIDPSQIWPKIAGKVVYAISSNSSNKIGHFWAHFGPFFGVGKFFSHFLATRWGRGGLETSKMDSARVKTYNSTYLPGLNSIRGPNGDIGDGWLDYIFWLIHPPTTNNQPSTFAISSNTYFIDRVVFSPFWALFWGFKLDFNPSTGKKLLGPPP